MAKQAAWKRPGSPIGRKGPRKANPKYKRRMNEPWTKEELKALKELADGNTPTGVISLKMGRTPGSIRNKAQQERISLGPVNRSPYTRRSKKLTGAAAAARTKAKKGKAGRRGGRR